MRNLRQQIRRIVREELSVVNEGVDYNDVIASLIKVKRVVERMLPAHDAMIKKASTHTYSVAPTGAFLYITPSIDKKARAARVTYQEDNNGMVVFRVTILSAKDRDNYTNYRAGVISKDFSSVGQAVSFIVNKL